MLNTLIKGIHKHYRWFTGATSIMAFFTVGTTSADDTVDQDIKLWLKESASEASLELGDIYYHNQLSPEGINGNAYLETDGLGIHNSKKNRFQRESIKAKERKLLRKIRDRFKINLLNTDGRSGKSRFYLSTLKKELVGKGRHGKTSYEIRISDDRTVASLRYRF
ncbi:MAG: hypothetical protein ACRBCI_01240 [Cellvibrionaceae bacterium]